MKLTIISGGQTGADRGAHDAAIHLGLDRGGWAPHGFAAEDGRIPEIYASTMREAVDRGDPGANLAHRTRLNVQDSDATLLFSFTEELTGGTKHTANTCKQQRKNCQVLVLPARGRSRIPDGVRAALLEWLRKHGVEVLNVAGPRESKAPGMQSAVRDALVWILEDEVAENLREGAAIMDAIGAVVDSDAPRAVFAQPFEYPLSPERQAGLDASIRQAEVDIVGLVERVAEVGGQPDHVAIPMENVDAAIAAGLEVSFVRPPVDLGALIDAECSARHAAIDAKEREMDEHGYGGKAPADPESIVGLADFIPKET